MLGLAEFCLAYCGSRTVCSACFGPRKVRFSLFWVSHGCSAYLGSRRICLADFGSRTVFFLRIVGLAECCHGKPF